MYIIRDDKKIEIELSELNHRSREKVFFTCLVCKKEKSKAYRTKDEFDCVCSSCKRMKTTIEKYGSYNNREKVSQTWENKSKEEKQKIIKKTKQTKLEKYGNENYVNQKKARKTFKERYGVETGFQTENNREALRKSRQKEEKPIDERTPNEKREQTNIEKYGVPFVLNSEFVKQKSRKTKLEKYGDENYNNRVKAKKTFLEKYGFDHPLKNDKIKEKTIRKQIEKYGKLGFNTEKQKRNREINFYNNLIKRNNNLLKPLFSLEDFLDRDNKYKKFDFECNTCKNIVTGHVVDGIIPRCLVCFPYNHKISNSEREIVDFIKSLNISNIEENNREILKGKELDIYLPEYNLAIEFDGLYWHSELLGKDKNYHLNKTLECEKQNIQLLHIFEDEWLNKQDIIKNIIKVKLGILENKVFARKCIINEIENQKDFLNENHIQGYTPSFKNLGLYFENKLVSLLTFSKSRYNKRYDWEIIRFVNKKGYNVIGGFSKLLKYFRNNYSGSIITYSDRRLFDGKVYEKNDFKKLNPSKQSYFYTDYTHRYNRQQFQKHKLKNLLESYDSSLTEWENMQLNGWDRIWDCGNNVFILE